MYLYYFGERILSISSSLCVLEKVPDWLELNLVTISHKLLVVGLGLCLSLGLGGIWAFDPGQLRLSQHRNGCIGAAILCSIGDTQSDTLLCEVLVLLLCSLCLVLDSIVSCLDQVLLWF